MFNCEHAIVYHVVSQFFQTTSKSNHPISQDCVVPENIHTWYTYPKEGYQKLQGGGGFKSTIFKEKYMYDVQPEFLERWGIQT